MTRHPWEKRAWGVLLLLLLCALAVGALAYRGLWMRSATALEQLQARSERLEGIVKAGPQIEALLAKARTNVIPLVQPGGDNAPNNVQQKLRELITNAGGTLVSSQVAQEAAKEGQMARIRLTATATGDWANLVRLMELLQAQRPPFWVRSAVVMREGASDGPGPQTARLALQLEVPMGAQKGKP